MFKLSENKRLKQNWVKSEKVVRDWDFFVNFKQVSASCKWALFICTMNYIIPQLRRC